MGGARRLGHLFYAQLYFLLSYTLDHLRTVSDLVSFWLTLLPYMIYPVWLLVTLLTRPAFFRQTTRHAPDAHAATTQAPAGQASPR